MRTAALISGLILALALSGAQQPSARPKSAQPARNNKPAQSAPRQTAPGNPAPKTGSFTLKGTGIKFFSRADGTLTIKGHGFVIVGDLKGEIRAQGFRELKQLPRGVSLNPPINQRFRVFHGRGTLTIQGKYDSLKASLTEAEISFRGAGSFEMMGVGKGIRNGKELVIYPSAATPIIVPEPAWQAQPPPVQPAPGAMLKGRTPPANPPATRK